MLSVRTDKTDDITVLGWWTMCGEIFLEIISDFYLKLVL